MFVFNSGGVTIKKFTKKNNYKTRKMKKIQRGGVFFGPLFSLLGKKLRGGGVVKKTKINKRRKCVKCVKKYVAGKKIMKGENV